MYLLDEKLVVSASDLNAYTACRHLLRLNLEYARGERKRPDERDPTTEIVARKGDEHEANFLDSLKAEGQDVIEIEQGGGGLADLEKAAADTIEAMRGGAEVIYQATFFEDGLRGHADFLFRVDRPSDLGEWSYEVADTKLARRAKPYFILQLCFYSELLARVQGVEPEQIHVILGTREQHSFRLAEFSAYYHRVRQRMLDDLAAGVPDTYPDPVDHCSICDWRTECDQRRIDDDHLSLVAWMTRLQRESLNKVGISTLAGLAEMPKELEVPGIRRPTLERLRAQAAIQLQGREEGKRLLELLEPEELRGLGRIPELSPGDVFFDLEGDPFFDQGLEYLWGYVTVDAGEPEFTVIWGRDREEERRAFEGFIDFVCERRKRYPDLHVYHYAHYEMTVLKRLAGFYGTREEELDQLLRDQVFVDLFKVVREAMRISEPGYGLKKVEGFYLEGREAELTDGEGSIVMFEQWLEGGGLDGGDQSILDQIADYNKDDCVSTYLLREWLLERRADAAAKYGKGIDWFTGSPEEPSEVYEDPDSAPLIAQLEQGLPADPVDMDNEQQARHLLAQLLSYHQREARPVWWMFFDRIDADPNDLIDDADCVAGLRPDSGRPPEPDKQSELLYLAFPPQEAKPGPGSKVVDTVSGRPEVKITSIDAEAGQLTVRRGPSHKSNPPPVALIPGGPYTTPRQRESLRRLARVVLDHGLEGDGPYRACRDILLGRPPRLADRASGDCVQPDLTEAENIAEIVGQLDEGALFIQGPPGSGKTYKGARVICELIRQGNRVGVTSTSHKAIHNLLEKIEAVASKGNLDLRGLKKHGGDNPESVYESALDQPLIRSVDDNAALLDPDLNLTGGTAWHYCTEGADASLDYLFIDEAGQISLADALALGTSARNIVLLGDPQQLPQVTQGAHPAGAGRSVLEHLLGDRQTIPPDEGIFLDQTYRMHPEVCALISELMYEGRLESADGCEAQAIEAPGEISGVGIRWLPVEHTGNAQSSVEEAGQIAAAINPLLANGSFTDSDGVEDNLAPNDALVVTPYNAQVQCLRTRLPEGVRVGTVDKFQGQEAQIVFFSMATSSAAELPRNLEFLFSRNRLNVAISRARCIASVVASPALLDTEPRTIEQMRLVNALCRVAEVAT
jgi:predicted RecB family nuclease